MSLFIKICEIFLIVYLLDVLIYFNIHNKLLHYYILHNERIITHLIYGVKNIFTEYQLVKCSCEKQESQCLITHKIQPEIHATLTTILPIESDTT